MMTSLPKNVGVATELFYMDGYFVIGTSKGYILKYSHGGDSSWSLKERQRVAKRSIRRITQVAEYMLVATEKGAIFIITPSEVKELCGEQSIGDISYLLGRKDSQTFFIGTDEGDIHECSLKTDSFQVLKSYDHHDDYISSMIWVPSKKTLIASSGDGTISVIDLKKQKLAASSKNFEADVTSLCLLPSHGKLAIGNSMGEVKLLKWNYWGAPCDSLRSSLHDDSSINDLILIQDSPPIMASATDEGSIRIVHANPLSCGLEIAKLDESIERITWFPSTSDGLGYIGSITIDDPSFQVVKVTESMLISSPGSLEETDNSDFTSSESDSESDKPITKKPKKSSSNPPKSIASNQLFFKDL